GFMVFFPFATMLVGLGLAPRFEGMDLLKAACYGFVVVGALAMVNFLYAMFIPDTDLEVHLAAHNLMSLVGSACLFIVGIGMYQGRSELVADDAT
ncbi:MAG: hypothetical protein OXC71_09695, partial [Chloroflexi bacterium]|nr:hypothetical protein [Chloroflexota bacterium]